LHLKCPWYTASNLASDQNKRTSASVMVSPTR
jgi:hypothetical protein